MQAKQGDGARRIVCDVLEYLITIPEVKEAIKKDGSKIKLRFARNKSTIWSRPIAIPPRWSPQIPPKQVGQEIPRGSRTPAQKLLR